MLKPLTFSLSLAVALGLCSVSMAGGHDNCTTCGLASPQGVVASPQGHYAASCEKPCKPKRESCLKNLFHHEVKYEWVLKKKHVWHRHKKSSCNTCNTCASPVYPTGQHVAPTGQHVAPAGQHAAAAGQYTAPTAYGAAQRSAFYPSRPASTIASLPAEMTPAPGSDDVPPAPEVRGMNNGLLLPGGSR